MAGPSATIPVLQAISQSIKDTKREIKEAGNDAAKVESLVAKLKSQVKEQADLKESLKEGAGGGGFSLRAGKGTLRNIRGISHGLQELAEGKIGPKILYHLGHNAEHLAERALESKTGEKIKEAVLNSTVVKAGQAAIARIAQTAIGQLAGAAALPLVVGVGATLGVYAAANYLLEQAKAHNAEMKQRSYEISKVFARVGDTEQEQKERGREIEKALTEQYRKDNGAINISSLSAADELDERQKEILEKGVKNIEKVSNHSYRALQILGTDQYKQIREDLKTDLTGIRGKRGLQNAFINAKGGFTTISEAARILNEQIEKEEKANTDQKTSDEQQAEDDPTFTVRMRQRNRFIINYEKEMMERRGDWNPF